MGLKGALSWGRCMVLMHVELQAAIGSARIDVCRGEPTAIQEREGPPVRLAGVFCLLRVARISASMAACRVAGSSRMWRMMALMEGSSSGWKQAAGRSSTSFGPLPASTCIGKRF